MTSSTARPEDPGLAALAALRARAGASAQLWPWLNDPAAVEIARRHAMPLPASTPHLIRSVLRTRVLDRWATTFLADHPDATVVEIGSGLSTRFERVDNNRAHWVHIDPAEIVSLRETLIADSPQRTVVIGDLDDPSWLPALAERPAPHLILIESGPLDLGRPDARRLVSTVAAHCPAARIAARLRDRVELGAQLRELALQHVASRSVARELACMPPWSWWSAPVGAAARACLHTDPLCLLRCTAPGVSPVIAIRPTDRIRRHRSTSRNHPAPGFRAARHTRSRALLAARRTSTPQGSGLPTPQEELPCPRSRRSTH